MANPPIPVVRDLREIIMADTNIMAPPSDVSVVEAGLDRFFAYAHERHMIYVRKHVERLPRPWTRDEILLKYSFTNVYRELDKTTIWFREHIRDPLRDDPAVMFATIAFRWLNRIESWRTILMHTDLSHLTDQTSPLDMFRKWVPGETPRQIRMALYGYGNEPWVTGAYIIKTPDGMKKLDGALYCIDQVARAGDWRRMAEICLRLGDLISLSQPWNWLRDKPFMGDFMAYEVISDLRYTKLLESASDINTWANPGPGAMRGLNRIHGRALEPRLHKERYITEMQAVLAEAYERWPDGEHWPRWEMREVEHTLCEFDKYERARLGEGKPRALYRG